MKELESQLRQAFPSRQPSEELQHRIAAMSARPARKPRFVKLSLVGACAVAAIVLTIVLVPRVATASTVDSIASAIAKVPFYRIIETNVWEDGHRTMGRTTLYCQGKLKTIRPDFVRYTQPGKEIVFYPERKRAITFARLGAPDGLTSLSTIIDTLKKSSWIRRLSVVKERQAGRQVLRLSIESNNEPVSTYIYADEKSDLPFRAEIYWRTPDGKRRLQREVAVDYATPVSLADVEPAFGPDVEVLADSQLRNDWKSKLGMPVAKVGPLAIRNVSVTPEGYVYVLYTGGQKHVPFGKPATVRQTEPVYTLNELSDGNGSPYVPVDGFQGTMYKTDDTLVNGFVFGGQDLQIAVFVPLHSVQPAWPTSLKLVFQASGKNIERHMSFAAPNSAAIAEYFPYLGIAPENEYNLSSSVESARARQYLALGDYADAEKSLRESVRQCDMYAASIGQRVLNGSVLLDLGKALIAQGKTVEARTVLQRALEETNPGDQVLYGQIRQELGSVAAP